MPVFEMFDRTCLVKMLDVLILEDIVSNTIAPNDSHMVDLRSDPEPLSTDHIKVLDQHNPTLDSAVQQEIRERGGDLDRRIHSAIAAERVEYARLLAN